MVVYWTFKFKGPRPLKRVKGARKMDIDIKFRNNTVDLVGIDTNHDHILNFEF
jgi:hypothetical protein